MTGPGARAVSAQQMHTPEPWFAVNDGTPDEPMWSVKAARISGKPAKHEVALCATGDSPQWMETANAARIVACVNALAGMADPAAEIARMRASNAGLLAALKTLRSVCRHFWNDESPHIELLDAACSAADETIAAEELSR